MNSPPISIFERALFSLSTLLLALISGACTQTTSSVSLPPTSLTTTPSDYTVREPLAHDAAIEKVLNDCAKVTREINHSDLSAAQAARLFSTEMQKMDIRYCPPEFRAAFQSHINAWRNASDVFADNTPFKGFLESLAAGYFKDSSMLGASQQKASLAAQNINATYDQVSVVAAAYGARVPQSTINQ